VGRCVQQCDGLEGIEAVELVVGLRTDHYRYDIYHWDPDHRRCRHRRVGLVASLGCEPKPNPNPNPKPNPDPNPSRVGLVAPLGCELLRDARCTADEDALELQLRSG